MYAWLWRRVPGPTWLRLLVVIVAALLVVMALFTWVFPWVETHLPFNDVTVDSRSSG